MTTTTVDPRTQFALGGLALLLLGVVAPALFWAATQNFWFVTGPTLILQVAALALGVLSWRSPAGKVTVVLSGAVLLLLAAFIGFVAIIVLNPNHPF